jgi:hypothetical protein
MGNDVGPTYFAVLAEAPDMAVAVAAIRPRAMTSVIPILFILLIRTLFLLLRPLEADSVSYRAKRAI